MTRLQKTEVGGYKANFLRSFFLIHQHSHDTVLPIEYFAHIWQVSLQLSCGDTCQIWMSFKQSNRYICKVTNFHNREINKQNFSHSGLGQYRDNIWKSHYLNINIEEDFQNLILFFVTMQGDRIFRGHFNTAYELLNLRALKFSYVNKICIFQCMGKIFCAKFQRVPLKFHTKYLTHTLKDTFFIQCWNLKSS